MIQTADLHFSDKPHEGYRFDIFHWLNKQCKKYDDYNLLILGDLTEFKDEHNAKLVNRIVSGLLQINAHIFILKGNHDYIDPSNPFFKFVTHYPNIKFVYENPEVIKLNGTGTKCLMIPHVKKWPDLSSFKNKVDYVMLHQTVDGAIAETGAKLTGLSQAPVVALGAQKVFSGDIHKPQRCGAVTYVGSPYTTRFGDDFEPRVILVNEETGKVKNLHFKCPTKYSLKIRDPEELEQDERLKKGDHIKIQLELAREELIDWSTHKRHVLDICNKKGLIVFGIELLKKKVKEKIKPDKIKDEGKIDIKDNLKAFTTFCNRENLASNVREIGKSILKG